MSKVKDNRKVYTNQKLEANGIVAHFDGKGNPETKVLKVYRFHGDINQMSEMLQNFCIDNGYDKAVTIFS